jgi:group I intron endonuclease
MTSFVYIIQNKINHKIYVGKSNDPNVRWGVHRKVALGGREKYPNDFFAIHGSLAKYGFDNFIFEVIEQFDDEQDCLEAEGFWIQFFRSWDRSFGYNLSLGGDGSSPTEETRRKMSIAHQGEKHSQANLNEKQILEIWQKYSANNYTQEQLAEEYGVHKATVNDILTRKTWAHITKDLPNFVKKAYSRPGEQSGHNKITEEQVIEGIRLYNTGKHTYKEISELLGVKMHTIRAAIVGTNWKHIDRGLYAK